MIIVRNLEDQYEEKLYSTGDDYLDELLEKAFCEGYEYAQKEFGWISDFLLNEKQNNEFNNAKVRPIGEEFRTSVKKVGETAKHIGQKVKNVGQKLSNSGRLRPVLVR